MYQLMYCNAHDAVIAQRIGPPLDEQTAYLPRPHRRGPRTAIHRRARHRDGEL